MQACIDKPGSCSWSKTLGARIGQKGLAQSGRSDAVAQQMLGLAPNAVFVLLPVFAGLLMLAYRSRRMGYGTHFVFSLHMHSFWFLALIVIWRLPGVALLTGVLALVAHGVWTLHRVYRGRWWATLARAVLVLLAYLVALALTMQALGIASVLLAE